MRCNTMKLNFFMLIFYVLSMIAVSVKAGSPGVGGNDDVKARALVVLEQKCNVCHAKKNPRKMFTPATMSLHAEKIYKQVFVKRRMPKGDAVRLSAQEEAALLQWLETTGVVKK